ncbi:hypothetical protein [Streptomyces lasiicapitis]|uniref:hypothetical protein n=1 Tax=Streptomyces lasiicapitis TaxID=1923961 RepID=UPI0036A318AF
MSVTDLIVIENAPFPPEGWNVIAKDLNAGAGGEYLYFAFELNGRYAPITDIIFLLGDQAAPPNYRKIPVDLNKGAGGDYIYAAYTRSPDQGNPIQFLDVLISDEPGVQPPKGWERYDTDLNKGAGGKNVYLIHQDT